MITQKMREYILESIPFEELLPLNSVAEVLIPSVTSKSGKNLFTYEYPLDYEKLINGRETSVQLHKYDIIMRGRMVNKLYMVDEEPRVPIYATSGDAVIRPYYKMQPEYLYLFLKSKTCQEIRTYFSNTTLVKSKLKRDDFNSIHVINPTLTEHEYRIVFEIENHYNVQYESYNKLIGCYKNAACSGVASVFNEECVRDILKNKKEAFIQLIKADVGELNACYNAKAYKASLIIAGSILEAVLLDWLGEMDGVDYFKEEQENKHGDNLYDFINAIKYIKKPRWYKGADMSHKIRQKRNLVHAKLGFNSDEVNGETCKMVIEYLEQVIRTRISLTKK